MQGLRLLSEPADPLSAEKLAHTLGEVYDATRKSRTIHVDSVDRWKEKRMAHKMLRKRRALIYLILVLSVTVPACSKSLAGKYFCGDDYIELKPDGTYSRGSYKGYDGVMGRRFEVTSGDYELNGEEVIIWNPPNQNLPRQVWKKFELSGDRLKLDACWVKESKTASSSSQRRTASDTSTDRGTDPDIEQGVLFVFAFLGLTLLYSFIAFCLQKIAQKLGHKDEAPWAWIPILNIFLLLKIAGWSAWTFVLLLIPIVNVFVLMATCASVCDLLHKSRAIALGMVIPGVNLICLGHLAFSKTEEAVNLSMTVKSEGTNQPEALEVEEHALIVRDAGRTLLCRFCGYQFAPHDEMATRCPECRSTAKQAQQENNPLERKDTPAT